MNIFKKYNYKLCTLSSGLAFFLVINISAFDKTQGNIYREQVCLAPGRDTYITSEEIWFEAFCLNKTTPGNPVLSKVLYVELINDKNRHILGQVLYIKENSAGSSITIPDTLLTGMYYLKAYTQWMENFGPETFSSVPVFIYNQFDEQPSGQIPQLRVTGEPKVYIEGSNLFEGMKSKVEVSFPSLKGKETPIIITDAGTNAIITRFIADSSGDGSFDFSPEAGHKYICSDTDSATGNFSFNLPEASGLGYKINIISISESAIVINIGKHNVESQKLELQIKSGDKIIEKKTITQDNLGKELMIPFVPEKYLTAQLLLKDSFGKILAINEFIYLPNMPIVIDSLQINYQPREQINFKVQLDGNSGIDTVKASVSVHKTRPSLQSKTDRGQMPLYNPDDVFYSKLQDNFYTILPKYTSGLNLPDDPSEPGLDMGTLLPVEDMGIIISGTAKDFNKNPLPGLEIIFSMKDSIPNLQSIITDENGRFAFLLNEYEEQHCYFQIFKEKNPLNERIEINIDNKFFYQRNMIKHIDLNPSQNLTFINDLNDEAKRVLIQKVFTDKKNIKLKPVFAEPIPSYFDNSIITVYPGDFFDLPNFEEISREILPLVRYKKTNEGCGLSIYSFGTETRSHTPLVLVDGVPVINKCDLFNLSSEMINKIQIQPEPRIVGNLYYDGLISISCYANKEVKYSDNPNSYPAIITGYNAGNEFAEFAMTNGQKDSRPEFRNQLYWDTYVFDRNKKDIKFYTSDEEGEYIVEINGFTKGGIPVYVKQKFTVTVK
jgi:hypothetical protein